MTIIWILVSLQILPTTCWWTLKQGMHGTILLLCMDVKFNVFVFIQCLQTFFIVTFFAFLTFFKISVSNFNSCSIPVVKGDGPYTHSLLAGQDMLDIPDWAVLPAQRVVWSVLLALSAAGQTRLVSDRPSAPCQDIFWVWTDPTTR